MVQDYGWDQRTADEQRRREGRGTAACVYIQCVFGYGFLAEGSGPALDRSRISSLVREYERQALSGEGMVVRSQLATLLAGEVALTFQIVEGYVDQHGNIVSRLGDAGVTTYPEITTTEELASALFCTTRQHKASDVHVMLTNRKQKSSALGTAHTYGIFVARRMLTFIDTHRRVDVDGEELGMVQCTLQRTGDLERDFLVLAQWIVRFHARKAGIKPPFDMLSWGVNWEASLLGRIKNNVTWSKVLAIKSLLGRMKPGDFLIDSFFGIRIAQLGATGMKFYHVQRFLRDTIDDYGGEEIEKDMGRLVSWLLNAYVNAPRVPEGIEAQGQISYATGPTLFLKQCEIISNKPQYPGDTPILSDTKRLYYRTLSPTTRLENVQQAFLQLDMRLDSASDFVRLQNDVIDVLTKHLLCVGRDYVGPYLAKKLLDEWAAGKEFNYDEIPMNVLAAMSADKKGGLDIFPPHAPSGVLGRVLEMPPPHAPMWHCLLLEVEASSQYLTERLADLDLKLVDFLQRFDFPPSPAQLVKNLDNAQTASPRRRKVAWQKHYQAVLRRNVESSLDAASDSDGVAGLDDMSAAASELSCAEPRAERVEARAERAEAKCIGAQAANDAKPEVERAEAESSGAQAIGGKDIAERLHKISDLTRSMDAHIEIENYEQADGVRTQRHAIEPAPGEDSALQASIAPIPKRPRTLKDCWAKPDVVEISDAESTSPSPSREKDSNYVDVYLRLPHIYIYMQIYLEPAICNGVPPDPMTQSRDGEWIKRDAEKAFGLKVQQISEMSPRNIRNLHKGHP